MKFRQDASGRIPDAEARKIGISARTVIDETLTAALAWHAKNARIEVIAAGAADVTANFTGKDSEEYAAVSSESQHSAWQSAVSRA